jgi:hypothetical protein
MPFRVHHDGLLPGKVKFHWQVKEIGIQRNMSLNRHILATAKASATWNKGNPDLVILETQQRSYLTLINIDALSLAV